MGKELIKSTSPKDLGGKISIAGKVVRFGSIPLIIAVLTFSADCAKKPSPNPQAPTGITDNSPQFPQGSDRPLQSQPKKETPTPASTPKKEVLAPVPTEKTLEQGWKNRQSLNFPYSINVPPGWTMNSVQMGGQKQDIFTGEAMTQEMRISSEPMRNGVTLNDYTDNFLAQITQANLYAEDTVEIKAKLAKKRAGESGISYGWVPYTYFGSDKVVEEIAALSKTKIANQATKIFTVIGIERNNAYPKELFPNETAYHAIIAIFMTGGQAWTVTLRFPLTKEENALVMLDTFQKTLDSVKLIR